MKKILLLFLLFLPLFAAAQRAEAEKLIAGLSETTSDTQKVNRLVRIAELLDFDRDPELVKYAGEALEISRRIGYTSGEAGALLMLGFAEDGKSHYAAAISYYEKSMRAYSLIPDTAGEARALANLSNAEYFLGDYTAAADHALQAIRRYEMLKNYRGLISAYIALGNVYGDQGLYTDALSSYREAHKAAKHFTDKPDYEGRVLVCIGNIYQFRKNLDSCIWYYNEALRSFRSIGAKMEISICLNNIATAYREQKKPGDAEKLLQECLSIRRSLGDTDGVCSAFQNLSSVAADRGEYKTALGYVRYALSLAYLTGSVSQRLTCFKGMAESFADLKNYDSAYYYLDEYTALNDSIRSKENIDALGQLKSRYNDEKQENKLALIESARKTEQAESDRNIALLVIGIVILLGLVAFIYARFIAKQRHTNALERKNTEITLQKNAITDSINYARRIQDSILPPDHHVENILPQSFIFYAPKDVVSGDFYWVEKSNSLLIFAAVDCTGHGVPGALMSVVGFNLLNQAVNEMNLTRPADILHHLDYGVNKLLRQSDTDNTVKDGMDLAVCTLDPKTRELQYAGVFNPAYIVSNGQLTQLRADKFPIGINVDGKTDNYTNHSIRVMPGDMIYLFSDGYADQFGGPAGKKFMYNRFRLLLTEISGLPVKKQKEILGEKFTEWKGTLEQIDDVLIIGVRVE